MEFKADKLNAFKALFKKAQPNISAFKGCDNVELYQDKNNPTIFFTYSHWINDEALQNYRESDFFKKTWSETKLLFDNKPEAWSVDKID